MKKGDIQDTRNTTQKPSNQENDQKSWVEKRNSVNQSTGSKKVL